MTTSYFDTHAFKKKIYIPSIDSMELKTKKINSRIPLKKGRKQITYQSTSTHRLYCKNLASASLYQCIELTYERKGRFVVLSSCRLLLVAYRKKKGGKGCLSSLGILNDGTLYNRAAIPLFLFCFVLFGTGRRCPDAVLSSSLWLLWFIFSLIAVAVVVGFVVLFV